MASPKKIQTIRRRPQRYGPPSAPPRKKAGRRAKRFYLTPPFSRIKVQVSLRGFRTNPARRSERYEQWVIRLNAFGIREVAITAKPLPGRPRRKKPAAAVKFPYVRWNIALPAVLMIAGLGGSLYFGLHLQKSVSFNVKPQSSKVLAVSEPASSAKALPKSIPTRLEIPKIGLGTDLSQVGLQQNGAIEMPWDIGTAAWYKYSPTPGELGPSIIVGHLDGADYADMTGVFWRLHELTPGDEINVARADGTVATFKVTGLKQVSQKNFPTQEIYGNIGYAGIRLVTCGGTFDQTTGHYTDNTVVFGALE